MNIVRSLSMQLYLDDNPIGIACYLKQPLDDSHLEANDGVIVRAIERGTMNGETLSELYKQTVEYLSCALNHFVRSEFVCPNNLKMQINGLHNTMKRFCGILKYADSKRFKLGRAVRVALSCPYLNADSEPQTAVKRPRLYRGGAPSSSSQGDG